MVRHPTEAMIDVDSNSELADGFSCGRGSEITYFATQCNIGHHFGNAVQHVAMRAAHGTYSALGYPWGHKEDGDAQAEPRELEALVGVAGTAARALSAHASGIIYSIINIT